VKRGKKKEYQRELWYDPQLEPYLNDESIELANGLVWCGEMNILPTAVDPLSGLETYSHRKSAIFPHAKLAMRSIATMLDEGAKLNYTTGMAVAAGGSGQPSVMSATITVTLSGAPFSSVRWTSSAAAVLRSALPSRVCRITLSST